MCCDQGFVIELLVALARCKRILAILGTLVAFFFF